MADFVVSLPTDPGLIKAVGPVPGVEFVSWNLDGPPPRPQIDIVVPPYWGGQSPLARISEVETRLVQWQSIGYDGVENHLPKGVPFANAATVHETSTAELALALALASQRGMDEFVRDGDQKAWRMRNFPSLADRNVLLVGYGGVGKAIESRLTGFEVQIGRLALNARKDQSLAGDEVDVRGLSDLRSALAQAEVVFVAVPLTDSTHHLFDAAALAAMPDGSLLVNVARGPVVDTEALMDELRSGRIRAALDVTDPEPLPENHPLWDCPGLLISPHVGGDSSAMIPRMAALIKRQIARLRAGETPENLVLGA